MITVKDHAERQGQPPGKLADAEMPLHRWPARRSETDRLCHLGTSRQPVPQRHVSRRAYSVNGERRSFALLRPIVDASAQDCPAADPRRVRRVTSEAIEGWGDDRPLLDPAAFADLLAQAVNEPGIVAGLPAFHNYCIGNQLLAWSSASRAGSRPARWRRSRDGRNSAGTSARARRRSRCVSR